MQVDGSANIYIVGSTVGLDSSASGTNLMIGKWSTTDMSQTWAKGWGGSDGNEVIKIHCFLRSFYKLHFPNKFDNYRLD